MRQDWHDKHYAFFQNRECEYFPCPSGVDETDFNCLFCSCPLYLTGETCGGNFAYSRRHPVPPCRRLSVFTKI